MFRFGNTGAALRAAAAASVLGAAALTMTVSLAHAQDGTAPVSEHDLRERLVWDSPWESRSRPPQLYSFRTVFRVRQGRLVAETVSYATNQRSASVVTLQNGRIQWQDSNGSDVNVTLAPTGELLGSANSADATFDVVFKPRP